MTTQFNTEIPETLARDIKADAARLGISLGNWSALAFKMFLAKPVSGRRELASGVARKTSGRNCKP